MFIFRKSQFSLEVPFCTQAYMYSSLFSMAKIIRGSQGLEEDFDGAGIACACARAVIPAATRSVRRCIFVIACS